MTAGQQEGKQTAGRTRELPEKAKVMKGGAGGGGQDERKIKVPLHPDGFGLSSPLQESD